MKKMTPGLVSAAKLVVAPSSRYDSALRNHSRSVVVLTAETQSLSGAPQ
ncbi:MAG: hypothetical protein ACLFR1_10910 [Spirochaetia bacterium]